MSSLDRRSFLKTTAAGLAVLPAARGAALEADEDPLGVRSDFRVTESLTYLNTASVGPFPEVVREAGRAYVEEQARSPLFAAMPEKIDAVHEAMEFTVMMNGAWSMFFLVCILALAFAGAHRAAKGRKAAEAALKEIGEVKQLLLTQKRD